METSVEQQPVTAWFRADAFHPALPGYYQVRSAANLPMRSTLRLVGVDLRYWNGSAWLTWERGLVSDFGQHESHEWRGQRRWVLRCYSGGMKGLYLVGVRRGGIYRYSPNAINARPFMTQRSAERFAARYPILRLVPVLP